MEARTLQTRRMTNEEVLDVLRSYHSLLVQYGEAEDFALSHDTRVSDFVYNWEDIAWRTWPTAARVLNHLFGIDASLKEWKPVLTPQKKRNLQDICEFIAQRAVVAKIPATNLLGKPCRAAGAFLTIRAMLEERGVDTSELAPSTPLNQYANEGMPEVYMQLTRAAPALMSRFETTYRSDAGHILLGVLLFFSMVALIVVTFAYSPVIGALLGMFTPGALILVQRSSVEFTSKPCRVEVNGLRDFRDLSRVLAVGKPDQPGASRSSLLE